MLHFLLPMSSFVGLRLPAYNMQHMAVYGNLSPEPNQAILAAVDRMQATAPDGGGYFTGIKAMPPESPIGVPLELLGHPLIHPPRTSSYCSGASYAAFIGGLDTLLQDRQNELSEDRFEAIRMQEPDGSRREDMVKLWGWWNADGPGSYYALGLYTPMGSRVNPIDAQPGDFCNIDWVNGPGHSVIFLGWDVEPDGQVSMRYWSSQKGTNGMGDQTKPLSTMTGFVFTRLTHPEGIFVFDPTKKMEKSKVEYDSAGATALVLKQSLGQ